MTSTEAAPAWARELAACGDLADQARAIQAAAPRRSAVARSASRLATILDRAASPDEARAAVRCIGDPERRTIALRLLDGIEASRAAWAVEDLPGLVDIAWLELQARGNTAEASAVLKARVRQVAADVRQQLEATAARATTAEAKAASEIDRAVSRYQRKAERLARDFAGMGAADLSAGIDPHGWYVYLLWGDDTERPVYVGRSENILSRLGSHMGERGKRSRTRRITLVPCASYEEMCRREDQLIEVYQPELNIAGVRRRELGGVSSGPRPLGEGETL